MTTASGLHPPMGAVPVDCGHPFATELPVSEVIRKVWSLFFLGSPSALSRVTSLPLKAPESLCSTVPGWHLGVKWWLMSMSASAFFPPWAEKSPLHSRAFPELPLAFYTGPQIYIYIYFFSDKSVLHWNVAASHLPEPLAGRGLCPHAVLSVFHATPSSRSLRSSGNESPVQPGSSRDWLGSAERISCNTAR